MTMHTEGPWAWRKHSNGELFCLEDRDGASIVHPCSDIGEYGLSSREYVEVELADARLIAAAPDLLTALKDAIGALEFSRDFHSDLGNEEQAFAQDKLDAARAAITKATPEDRS